MEKMHVAARNTEKNMLKVLRTLLLASCCVRVAGILSFHHSCDEN